MPFRTATRAAPCKDSMFSLFFVLYSLAKRYKKSRSITSMKRDLVCKPS